MFASLSRMSFSAGLLPAYARTLTGLAGAKVWRRTLSDTALIREQGADIFRYAYGKAGWADVESFPDEDRRVLLVETKNSKTRNPEFHY